MNPELKSIKVDGASMDYLDYAGDNPTVVFLHATGFMPWLWHPIAREIAGAHHILAPAFCSHRMSDPHAGGLAWYQLAGDLVLMLGKLGIERPVLVGHSMGGAIATIAVGELGLDVAGMLLIEPIYLPREIYGIEMTVDQHPLAARAIRRRNGWADDHEARDYLRSRKLFADWDGEMLELYIEHGMQLNADGRLVLKCEPEQEASLFMGSRHYDPWPLLPKIGCPVWLLEGELSENRVFIDLKAAAELLPAGHYESLDGLGHLMPMEDPGRIETYIWQFLKDI